MQEGIHVTAQRFGLLIACLVVCFIGCRPADPGVVTIVSSLPRTGSAKQQSDTIVGGIRMAIEEAGGQVGPFRVEYLDLDDSTAAAGQWTSEAEAANARRALQDPDVVAYIGTFNSGAAKVSMPISRQRSSKRSAMPLPYTSVSSRMYTFVAPRFLAQSAESGPWRSSAGTTRV